jgi:hypothetical protein
MTASAMRPQETRGPGGNLEGRGGLGPRRGGTSRAPRALRLACLPPGGTQRQAQALPLRHLGLDVDHAPPPARGRTPYRPRRGAGAASQALRVATLGHSFLGVA